MVEKDQKRTGGCWLLPIILLLFIALLGWLASLNAVLNDHFGGELVRGNLNQDSIQLLVMSTVILICGFLLNKYYEKKYGLKIKELKEIIKTGKYSESATFLRRFLNTLLRRGDKGSQVNEAPTPGRLTISPGDKNVIRRGFKVTLVMALVGGLASVPGVFPDLLKGRAGSGNSNLEACPDQIKSGAIIVETCYPSNKSGDSTWCDSYAPSEAGKVTYDSHGVRLVSGGEGSGYVPNACLDELGISH